MTPRPTLLILTVGTGTAGPKSNLVEGLRNTIRLIAPRAFWLVPSTSEDSQLVADYVRENNPAFSPFSQADTYGSIPSPDDLENCRAQLRSVIAHVRTHLRPGERILINPTSGTKQMSAGATLAALDENIGNIVFTVGQRSDGVVITGTEHIASFDASAYFRERDFALANNLFSAGSFFAAAQILKPHALALPKAHGTALVYHDWQHFDYEAAVEHAKGGNLGDLRASFATRMQHAKSATPSPLILSDLLTWSDYALRKGYAANCLMLAYKALEYGARCAFHTATRITPNQRGFYKLSDLKKLSIRMEIADKFSHLAPPDVPLGLKVLMQILQDLGHDMGRLYFHDRRLEALTHIRNETVHDIRPVTVEDAKEIIALTRPLLTKTIPTAGIAKLQTNLPQE